MSFRTTAQPKKETFTRKVKVSKKTKIITTALALLVLGVAFAIAIFVG